MQAQLQLGDGISPVGITTEIPTEVPTATLREAKLLVHHQ